MSLLQFLEGWLLGSAAFVAITFGIHLYDEATKRPRTARGGRGHGHKE